MIGLANAKKTLEKPHKRRPGGFVRKLLVLVVAIGVAVLIAGSLWVSIDAMIEKVKVSRVTSQILDIVDMARHLASLEAKFGSATREDIIARLVRTGQIKIADENGSGLMTLVNPWGGALTTFTVSSDLFRMETVVPSRSCARIVSLLIESNTSLGLKQVDTRSGDESWRQIYASVGRGHLGSDEVAAGCRSDKVINLALSFALR